MTHGSVCPIRAQVKDIKLEGTQGVADKLLDISRIFSTPPRKNLEPDAVGA